MSNIHLSFKARVWVNNADVDGLFAEYGKGSALTEAGLLWIVISDNILRIRFARHEYKREGDSNFFILPEENWVEEVINLLKVLRQGPIHSDEYDLTRLLIEPLLY